MSRHINIGEFRAEGYLQELNRKFLHPLGLAMEVVVHGPGDECLSRIWDCRDEPEGVLFGNDTELDAKARRINGLWLARCGPRIDRLGYMIQPTRHGSSGRSRGPKT